jgi:hypothetical protein
VAHKPKAAAVEMDITPTRIAVLIVVLFVRRLMTVLSKPSAQMPAGRQRDVNAA